MQIIHDGEGCTNAALAGVPAIYLLGALLASALPRAKQSWVTARAAAAGGMMLTAVGALTNLAGWSSEWTTHAFTGLLGLRSDSLTFLMLGLITFVAYIILVFSTRYLAGDAGEKKFVTYFLATVASVSLLVITNHLAVLSLGWILTSLSLHKLLTYYDDRKPALLAAHKKFLISRLADVCVVTAFILIGKNFGTFEIDRILTGIETAGGGIGYQVEVATVLLALAAILKCAQLPFHGWLIQVMEAPTPVSALLHAGIVNIGGFLMIRLALLMELSPAAQWLLVVSGAATAVIASLVMMTRISVKVMLAWSTCAQMGFMLMECGLGAYSLALLHILAHSLYKAHSFLSSGSAVSACVKRQYTHQKGVQAVGTWLLAALIGAASVFIAALLFGQDPAKEPSLIALAMIVGIGIATFVGEAMARQNKSALLHASWASAGISVLYFGWHELFSRYTHLHKSQMPSWAMITFVLLAFVLQMALYVACKARSYHPAMVRLHAALYHGLYLDELFTRLTFKLWPPRLPSNRTLSKTHFVVLQPEGNRS